MIQINYLRISSDSEYLEFDVECPSGYTFTKLLIQKYSSTEALDEIDAKSVFETDPSSLNQIIRIAVSELGGTGLFRVTFGVTGSPTLSDVIAACSDVNDVYNFLLDSILNMQVNCMSADDYQLLTKNYLFLYAHQEAMRLERFTDTDFDEAGLFYDILVNNFTNCGNDVRSFGTRVVSNCGCS